MTQPLYEPNYFTGTGALTQYNFNFPIADALRLLVLITDTDGVETEQVLGVDYTIDFAQGTSGIGVVNLTVALPLDHILALQNSEDLTQETSLRNQGAYFPFAVEDALDKLTRIDQQLNVKINKSIRLPDGISEIDFDPTLPGDLAANAGAAIIVNPTGDGFILGLPSGSTLSGVTDTATIDLTLAANILSADIVAQSIANSHISNSAAIERTKFAAGTANRLVQNADSTGIMSDAAAITAARALISDANGIPTHSAVTSAELAYLSGLTDVVQDQLDDKLDLAGGTMTGTLTLSGAPSSSLDAATKAYVDSQSAGNLHESTAVRVATTTNGTLATAFDDGSTVDGVTLATGDRILIKDQTDATENGIYIVEASGAPTRATDADDWDDELVGIVVSVTAGTQAATTWANNNVAGGTFGVDDVTFVYHPFGQVGDAGNGLQKSGTTFSVKHDGATLSSSASGLKVADGGIANAQIDAAAAIAFSKMASLTANRALQSSAAGISEVSSVTSTELGYLSGVTGAIQTALDAKIDKSLGTTAGDIIYFTSSATPARLGVGTNGQVLTLAAGVPTWADTQAAGQSISLSVFRGTTTAGSTNLTLNAWTPFTLLGSADLSSGTPFSRSGNDLTPPFTGKYTIDLVIPKVSMSGNATGFACRVRNTTSGATAGVLGPDYEDSPEGAVVMTGEFSVTNTSHVHQVQYYGSASGGSPAVTISNFTVGTETPPRFMFRLTRIGA